MPNKLRAGASGEGAGEEAAQKGLAEGLESVIMANGNDDPDWLRAKQEAERKDPLYWTKRNIEEIEVHLRYGIPGLKLVGWIIVALLALILWRVWK
jgi:hypothetical protein